MKNIAVAVLILVLAACDAMQEIAGNEEDRQGDTQAVTMLTSTSLATPDQSSVDILPSLK